jgi:protocatechuate 3,4-dioxygenase beta subunit
MKMVAGLVVVFATWAWQGPQQPPRDTRPPAQEVGTGEIRGRVLAGDTGAPLRRAMVTLLSQSQRPSVEGPVRIEAGTTVPIVAPGVVNRRVNTDETGSFVFSQLPPGAYRVMASPNASRPQYLGAAYGARQPLQPGKPLELGDGQRIDGADIVLPRAAVVTGRVTDDAGDPMARVMVYVLQSRGGQLSRSGPSAMTDDLGQFRLFGITPGDYVVGADNRAGGGPPIEGETIGFVTTYSPGTTNPSEASRVRLRAGQEAMADIRMVPGRLFKITGSVINGRGEPVQRASIQVMRKDAFGQVSGTGTGVDPEGRFTANGLVPGEYRLIARQMGATPGPGGPVAQREGAEMAIETVVVGESDLSDVLLVIRPGVNIEGTVVFDTPPPDGVRFRVMTAATDRTGATGAEATAEVTGHAFTLTNLFGEKLVRTTATATGWALKSVLLRGRDITDVPTAFTPQDSGHLQIVFTSRAPSLEGTVIGDDGEPAKDGGSVLIFGEDPATWIGRSSRLRLVALTPTGTFRMQGMREGQYYVVALAAGQSPLIADPPRDVLEALSKVATRVTLGPDEHRKVDLRLVALEGR